MKNNLAKKLAQTVTDFYETHGAAFSRTRRGFIWKEEKRAARFIASGMVVADIGAGNGRFARLLPPNTTYLGIEPSVPFRETDCSLLKTKGHGDVVPGSILAIPLADYIADVTVCFAVLHHIPGPDRKTALKELIRITKQGGLIIATSWCLEPGDPHITPIPESDPGDVWVDWNAEHAHGKRYVHLFSEEEWQRFWTRPSLRIEQLLTDRNRMAIVRVI